MDYVGERPGMGCEALNRPIQRHMLDNGQAPHRTSLFARGTLPLPDGRGFHARPHRPSGSGHQPVVETMNEKTFLIASPF